MEAVKRITVITDEMRNSKWDSMLKVFKKIIDGNPKPESVKEDLMALSESAKNTGVLTPRQAEGIVDRCSNYLKGNWGVDAIKDAYVSGGK